MTPIKKPLLVFDGDCGFCRRWVGRWRLLTEGRIDYEPFQEAAPRFPQIKPQEFSSAVQFIESDGKISQGAEAVFRLMSHVPGRGWMLWAYKKIPGVAWATETFYAIVARHRRIFSTLTRWLWGARLEPPEYLYTRWLFLRVLGFAYFFAFLSFWMQADGLLGHNGIMPAGDFLHAVLDHFGNRSYWILPSLCWIHPGDGILHLLGLAGTALSVLLILDVAPGPILLLLWAFYLSLVNVGQDFMSFQWDILLLEAGFLAIFFAPWKILPGLSHERSPSRLMLGLFRWLLFRLMLESGAVKLLSGDPTWKNLTALDFHYWTQPLPTWVGWYAAQLPAWFQKFSATGVFAVELAAPLLIFLPRRPRFAAFGAFVFLQVLIGLTGNYCFFNLLTLALCLLLLDDFILEPICVKLLWLKAAPKGRGQRARNLWRRCVAVPVACLVLLMGGFQLYGMLEGRVRPPKPLATLFAALEPWRVVNSYGLFAVMTTVRHEIVVEGSQDGLAWREYSFRWKPGDLNRRPGFVEPFQPRLDWQMWFAALGSYQENPWFLNFMFRILQGSPEVLSLLEQNPFPLEPPKYLRATIYDYRFTTIAEKRRTGNWWTRRLLGPYCPMVSLRGKAS